MPRRATSRRAAGYALRPPPNDAPSTSPQWPSMRRARLWSLRSRVARSAFHSPVPPAGSKAFAQNDGGEQKRCKKLPEITATYSADLAIFRHRREKLRQCLHEACVQRCRLELPRATRSQEREFCLLVLAMALSERARSPSGEAQCEARRSLSY